MNKTLTDFTSKFDSLENCKTYMNSRKTSYILEIPISSVDGTELSIASEVDDYVLTEVLISATRTRLCFK